MITDTKDIFELFSRPETAARPGYNFVMDDLTEHSNYGVALSNGKTWVEQRKFSVRALRDSGFGKRSAEKIIMEEVRELLSRLRENASRPLQTELLFNLAAVNTIWSMVAGKRYDYGDPKLVELIRLVEKFLKSANSFSTYVFLIFPGLTKLRRKVPAYLSMTTATARFREKMFRFLLQEIREHERTLVEGSPRDFIDVYLEKVKQTTDPSSSFYANEYIGDAPLVGVLVELFSAGSETTSKTLAWAFFLLAQHPAVQHAVAKEIRDLVGSREVVLADRPYLPYVEATILEVMRWAPVLPLGVPHSATEDIHFKGYLIPKGAMLVGNLYAAHFHPSTWGDPQNFRPERFLSPDKKTVIRHKAWIPFGTGKRQCPGELLARDELFLFFANLVSNLQITMPPDEPKNSLQGVNDYVLSPEPHNIIVRAKE